MCKTCVDNYSHALQIVSVNAIRLKKCMIKLSILIQKRNLFLNALWLKKCIIKQLRDAFLYLILFLIGIKLKKCVIELLLKIFFIVYCPDKYIT